MAKKKKRKGKKKKASPPLSKQKTTAGTLHHLEAFVVWEGRDVLHHTGMRGEGRGGGRGGAQTKPTGANTASCLACFSRYRGPSDDWVPPGAKNNKWGGSPAPTTTTPSGKTEEETLRIPGQAVGCLSQSHRETVHHPAVTGKQSANHTWPVPLLIYIFLK